jgi:hypothetical protein
MNDRSGSQRDSCGNPSIVGYDIVAFHHYYLQFSRLSDSLSCIKFNRFCCFDRSLDWNGTRFEGSEETLFGSHFHPIILRYRFIVKVSYP